MVDLLSRCRRCRIDRTRPRLIKKETEKEVKQHINDYEVPSENTSAALFMCDIGTLSELYGIDINPYE